MSVKREFHNLTPREAMQVAISIEERNAGIYHALGEIFAEIRDPDSLEIARAFWEMAAEERTHLSRLQARYLRQYRDHPKEITEAAVQEMIEEPKLDFGKIVSVKKGSAGRSARLRIAFEVAAKAERQALHFYRSMAGSTKNRRMRALFREFAAFENDHCEWVRKKLAQVRSSDQLSRSRRHAAH